MWSQVMRSPPERLEHHQSDWRLGVLHTVQYRCARTMSRKGGTSQEQNAQSVCQCRMSGTKCVVVEQSKSKLPNNCFTQPFTSLSLRKCPNVAHEPQYCNLRKTAVANIDTICKAQAIAQPPWPIAQITHDARCKRAHHNKEQREQQQASSSLTAPLVRIPKATHPGGLYADTRRGR